jgi:peptidoglycan/xylan/chitin deacetylase (PgdA/CDA1 family)
VDDIRRRRFLVVLAATTAAAISGCTGQVSGQPTTATAGVPVIVPVAPTAPDIPTLALPPRPLERIPLPGGGVLSQLPGEGDLLALTVDDGVNTEVVRLYTQFAKDTGVRLTYFVNGTYSSWTDNLSLLRPLVDARQIQLGNHTWSHPDLTTVSKRRVADELTRNDLFLKAQYGIDSAPYFRPPYGRHSASVDAVAASLGYTVPVLWSGSLSDSTVITEDYIVSMAQKYFTAQSIVIGHLNHLPVTHVYPQLVEVIRSRNLTTVTLDDVFSTPR